MATARCSSWRWRLVGAAFALLATTLAGAPVQAARPLNAMTMLSATDALRSYTQNFAAGRYDRMWALLAPAARAEWDGPAGLTAYYRAKFAPVRLVGVALGPPRLQGSSVQIALSLDLAWRGQGLPGILSLFQNVPATLARGREGWQIVDGGPLDPAAAVIPPPPTPVARRLRVPILMYHHISNAPPPAPSQIGLTVSRDDFAAQLDYLAAHGFHTITLCALFNALYYGRPLPARPVVLTFDDGYLDAYTDAFPLLRRHGMVGEFNVITGYAGLSVGVNSYMTWPQIAQMAAAGMEMESHTIDHQDLGLVDTAKAINELRVSRAMLAAHIHRAVQFLAYPSGEPFRSGSVAAQQRVLSLLPQFGYVGALLDQSVPSMLQDAGAPYELPRLRAYRGEPLADFADALGV